MMLVCDDVSLFFSKPSPSKRIELVFKHLPQKVND